MLGIGPGEIVDPEPFWEAFFRAEPMKPGTSGIRGILRA